LVFNKARRKIIQNEENINVSYLDIVKSLKNIRKQKGYLDGRM